MRCPLWSSQQKRQLKASKWYAISTNEIILLTPALTVDGSPMGAADEAAGAGAIGPVSPRISYSSPFTGEQIHKCEYLEERIKIDRFERRLVSTGRRLHHSTHC